MDAQAYNASVCDKLWKRSDLPWWLRDLAPSGLQFAREVRRYQERLGLTPDGKLGTGTWTSILATEKVRESIQGADFGPSWGKIVPSAREERKRSIDSVVGIGIHTTGSGIYAGARKLMDRGDKRPEGERVKQVIRNLLEAPSSYVSHAYIFPDGELWLAVPVDECAVHGAISPYRSLYSKGFEVWKKWRGTTPDDLKERAVPTRYDGWAAIMKGEGKPLDPFSLCTDPNSLLWAFDLVPAIVDDRETFTDQQFVEAARLCLWASERFGFALSFDTVLEHRLWSPITRWPWDPGANFSRRRLGDEIRRLSPSPLCLGGDDR